MNPLPVLYEERVSDWGKSDTHPKLLLLFDEDGTSLFRRHRTAFHWSCKHSVTKRHILSAVLQSDVPYHEAVAGDRRR